MERPHERLKVGHEMFVARQLMDFFRLTFGWAIGDPRPGDIGQRHPDVIFDSPAGLLGIEIAGAYYNRDFAKGMWDAARSGADYAKIELRQNVLDVNAALVAELNRVMLSHLEHYYSIPTYLVLDATLSGLSRAADAPLIVPKLAVPTEGSCAAVYLALPRANGPEVEIFDVAFGEPVRDEWEKMGPIPRLVDPSRWRYSPPAT